MKNLPGNKLGCLGGEIEEINEFSVGHIEAMVRMRADGRIFLPANVSVAVHPEKESRGPARINCVGGDAPHCCYVQYEQNEAKQVCF